jgi:hypothetical protein
MGFSEKRKEKGNAYGLCYRKESAQARTNQANAKL